MVPPTCEQARRAAASGVGHFVFASSCIQRRLRYIQIVITAKLKNSGYVTGLEYKIIVRKEHILILVQCPGSAPVRQN